MPGKYPRLHRLRRLIMLDNALLYRSKLTFGSLTGDWAIDAYESGAMARHEALREPMLDNRHSYSRRLSPKLRFAEMLNGGSVTEFAAIALDRICLCCNDERTNAR
jgi:hypothetical protein